jgi:hypothetical protein
MTINILLEMLLGKSCVMEGKFGDSTPFTKNSTNIAEELCDRLEKNGFHKNGWERLYSGYTGEMLDARIYIAPSYYYRLKHMVKDKVHCLAIEGTEVLTLYGWKNAHELTMKDKIATLKNGQLVYENPINIMLYPDYKGSMYYIKNQAIDLAVTGNHRMWTSKISSGKWSDYTFERADEIIGKHRKYKKDAEWEVKDYQLILEEMEKIITPTSSILIPEKILDMDSWLMFFGIWYAEGWASGTDTCGKVSISINKKRVKDNLYPALDKLGYEYTIDEKYQKLNISNIQLYRYMKPLSVGAPNKELPSWVFNLSRNQI